MARLSVEKPKRQRISDSDAAQALFAPAFAGLAHEAFGIAHLDADLCLIDFDMVHGGKADSVELPLRRLVGDALALQAHAVIVAHNHPLGDPAPSRADKVATGRLVAVTRPLHIEVIDHLIFARDRVSSFRALGLL